MAYSMNRNKDGTYSMPSSAEQKQQREDGTYAANAARNAASNASSLSGRSGSSNTSNIKQMPSPAAPGIPDKKSWSVELGMERVLQQPYLYASWSYEKLCYR